MLRSSDTIETSYYRNIIVISKTAFLIRAPGRLKKNVAPNDTAGGKVIDNCLATREIVTMKLRKLSVKDIAIVQRRGLSLEP